MPCHAHGVGWEGSHDGRSEDGERRDRIAWPSGERAEVAAVLKDNRK